MNKKKGVLKKLKIVILAIAGAVIFLCIMIYCSFLNEINTIMSIKKVSKVPVYEIHYKGDYALDKYLSVGSKDYYEYADF